MEEISKSSKDIVLLTQTFASPSTRKLIDDFKAKYKNVRHVVYHSISESKALDAYESKYGLRGLANYDFSKSKVIVSVGADFLGDWQGGGFDVSYAKGRIPNKGKMSRHIQFESNMTLSGANSDMRIPLKYDEQKLVILEIYNSLFSKKIKIDSSLSISDKLRKAIDNTIDRD